MLVFDCVHQVLRKITQHTQFTHNTQSVAHKNYPQYKTTAQLLSLTCRGFRTSHKYYPQYPDYP